MARLIDSEALIADFMKGDIYPLFVRRRIENAPAVDAVPVVRCRDCKFGDWDSEPNDAMVCMRTKDGFWRSGNDFCSFGEQKEGAE